MSGENKKIQISNTSIDLKRFTSEINRKNIDKKFQPIFDFFDLDKSGKFDILENFLFSSCILETYAHKDNEDENLSDSDIQDLKDNYDIFKDFSISEIKEFFIQMYSAATQAHDIGNTKVVIEYLSNYVKNNEQILDAVNNGGFFEQVGAFFTELCNLDFNTFENLNANIDKADSLSKKLNSEKPSEDIEISDEKMLEIQKLLEKETGKKIEAYQFTEFAQKAVRYSYLRGLKLKTEQLKKGLGMVQVLYDYEQSMKYNRSPYTPQSEKTWRDVFGETLRQYFDGDEDLTALALEAMGTSFNPNSSYKDLEAILKNLKQMSDEFYTKALNGESYEKIEHEYKNEFKKLYGMDDVSDEILENVSSAMENSGMFKISLLIAINIVLSRLSGGTAAPYLNALTAKYGAASVKLLVSLLTISTSYGLDVLNELTSKDGITSEDWDKINKQGLHTAGIILFSSFISGPIAEKITNSIKMNNVVENVFAKSATTASNGLSTATMSGQEFVKSLNQYFSSAKGMVQSGVAQATGFGAEVGMFALFDSMVMGLSYDESLKGSAEALTKIKVIHYILNALLGRSINYLSTSFNKSPEQFNMNLLNQKYLDKIDITEIKSPNGQTTYTVKMMGQTLFSTKNPNEMTIRLVSSIAQRLSQNEVDYILNEYKKQEQQLADAKKMLGLNDNEPLTEDAIQRAWKAKMKENHPDMGGNKEMAVSINNAKDFLFNYLKTQQTARSFAEPQNPVVTRQLAEATGSNNNVSKSSTELSGINSKPLKSIDYKEAPNIKEADISIYNKPKQVNDQSLVLANSAKEPVVLKNEKKTVPAIKSKSQIDAEIVRLCKKYDCYGDDFYSKEIIPTFDYENVEVHLAHIQLLLASNTERMTDAISKGYFSSKTGAEALDYAFKNYSSKPGPNEAISDVDRILTFLTPEELLKGRSRGLRDVLLMKKTVALTDEEFAIWKSSPYKDKLMYISTREEINQFFLIFDEILPAKELKKIEKRILDDIAKNPANETEVLSLYKTIFASFEQNAWEIVSLIESDELAVYQKAFQYLQANNIKDAKIVIVDDLGKTNLYDKAGIEDYFTHKKQMKDWNIIFFDKDGNYIRGDVAKTSDTQNAEHVITNSASMNYVANIRTDKKDKELLIDSSKEVLDKDGNVLYVEKYESSKDVPNKYNIIREYPDGQKYKIGIAEVTPSGHTVIEKTLVSETGVKTDYNYSEAPNGSRFSFTRVTDSKGSVIAENKYKYRVINENHFVTNENGIEYDIQFTKNEVIVTKDSGEKVSVSIGKNAIDSRGVLSKDLLPVLKNMPGSFYFAIAKYGLTKIGLGINDVYSDNAHYDDMKVLIALSEERKDSSFTLFHEFGHYLDFALGIKSNPELIDIYMKEREALILNQSQFEQRSIGYFIDAYCRSTESVEGSIGEIVAEINALLYASNNTPSTVFRGELLQQYFPETFAKVTELLQNPEIIQKSKPSHSTAGIMGFEEIHIPKGSLGAPSAKFDGTKEAYVDMLLDFAPDISFMNAYITDKSIMAKALNQIGNEGMDFIGIEHPFKIDNTMSDSGSTAFDGSSVVEINTQRFGLSYEFENDLAEMAHRVFHEKRHVYQNIQRSLGINLGSAEDSFKPLEYYASELSESERNVHNNSTDEFYKHLKSNRYDYNVAQDGRFPQNVEKKDIEYAVSVAKNQANYVESGAQYWTQFVENDAESVGKLCGDVVQNIIEEYEPNSSQISLVAKSAYCAQILDLDFDVVFQQPPVEIDKTFTELFKKKSLPAK